jgi:NADPH-dependent glutamate synthase beta subunit-like oxidoreductase
VHAFLSLSPSSLRVPQKTLHLHFLRSPTRLLPKEGESDRLGAVELERNQLVVSEDGVGLRAQGTGERELLACDALFYSIGYRGRPMRGLPFDDISGTMPNRLGRVAKSAHDLQAIPLPGVYVSGWLKRGPSGIIGTNKWDSEETADSIVEDLLGGALYHSVGESESVQTAGGSAALVRGYEAIEEGLTAWIKQKIVTFDQFKRIERKELKDGQEHGKVAEKLRTAEDMVRVAHKEEDGETQ